MPSVSKGSRGVLLATRFHLVPSCRVPGAIATLFDMPPWPTRG